MRPAGEVRQALFTAACTFHKQGMTATLRELAHSSKVGLADARRCVDNMKRSGALEIVGTRRVEYRNRPVSEYAPAMPTADLIPQGWVDLGQCMAVWAR